MLDGFTSFVPYESFEQGVQEHKKFLEGGLARGLVHTKGKKASVISPIANNKEYSEQVDVWSFYSVGSPLVRVIGLSSDGSRLIVDGGYLSTNLNGYAFGGLVYGKASAQKINWQTHSRLE